MKRQWGGTGSGISWTICKSLAPHSRQITTPAHHHSIFTGWILFLPPKQQCQTAEGNFRDFLDFRQGKRGRDKMYISWQIILSIDDENLLTMVCRNKQLQQ